MIFNVALNYGGRTEIIDAVNRLLNNGGRAAAENGGISEEDFAQYLYTAGQPDPDLLIRTSGELRVSNFLLWQIAYSEIYITETLWPDFDEGDFLVALIEYQKRDRRFGGVREAKPGLTLEWDATQPLAPTGD